MTDRLLRKLIYAGYRKMNSSTEKPGYGVYYEIMQNLVNAVIFVEADKYDESFVRDFADVFAKSMEVKGYATHTFTILLVNEGSEKYLEQQSIAHQVCAACSNVWVYDEVLERLVVYEGQAEEFYGLRNIIDNLEPPEDFKLYVDEPDNPVPFRDKLKTIWKNLPKVTAALILINVIVYIICTFKGELLYNKGVAGVSFLTSPIQWYRVISSMFLHINAAHIANNMLLLYFLGQIVEDKIGSGRFLAGYFLTGIAGTIATFISEIVSGEYLAVLGASGAVFGVLGMMFSLVFFKRIRRQHMTIGRLLFIVTLSVADGFTSSENIAVWSHLGGLVTGIIIGAIFCLCTIEKAGVKNED